MSLLLTISVQRVQVRIKTRKDDNKDNENDKEPPRELAGWRDQSASSYPFHSKESEYKYAAAAGALDPKSKWYIAPIYSPLTGQHHLDTLR